MTGKWRTVPDPAPEERAFLERARADFEEMERIEEAGLAPAGDRELQDRIDEETLTNAALSRPAPVRGRRRRARRAAV